MKQSTAERISVIVEGNRVERLVFQAAREFYKHMRQRQGQALMNGLRVQAPELYEILTGSIHDCFYDDAKIPEALIELGYDGTFYAKVTGGR